jgi:hypothetical protein
MSQSRKAAARAWTAAVVAGSSLALLSGCGFSLSLPWLGPPPLTLRTVVVTLPSGALPLEQATPQAVPISLLPTPFGLTWTEGMAGGKVVVYQTPWPHGSSTLDLARVSRRWSLVPARVAPGQVPVLLGWPSPYHVLLAVESQQGLSAHVAARVWLVSRGWAAPVTNLAPKGTTSLWELRGQQTVLASGAGALLAVGTSPTAPPGTYAPRQDLFLAPPQGRRSLPRLCPVPMAVPVGQAWVVPVPGQALPWILTVKGQKVWGVPACQPASPRPLATLPSNLTPYAWRLAPGNPPSVAGVGGIQGSIAGWWQGSPLSPARTVDAGTAAVQPLVGNLALWTTLAGAGSRSQLYNLATGARSRPLANVALLAAAPGHALFWQQAPGAAGGRLLAVSW